MSELTPDELTVLMIAERGESMIPIGRWEMPIRNLATKGFMIANDPVNYVITASGRQTLKEDDTDSAWARAAIAMHNKQVQVRDSSTGYIEQAATHLANAAKASSPITGDTPQQAAEQWSREVLRLAIEILNNG